MRTMLFRLVSALAVAAFVATPVLLGAEPAGAATITSRAERSIFFVDVNGATETCTIILDSTLYDDRTFSTLYQQRTPDGSRCYAAIQLSGTYHDANGGSHSVAGGGAGSEIFVNEPNAYGPVSSTADILFYDCDVTKNTTCSYTLRAAPK